MCKHVYYFFLSSDKILTGMCKGGRYQKAMNPESHNSVHWWCEKPDRHFADCIFKFIFLCHDDVIKWKHFPRYWTFVWEIHRSPVNSPHIGQWRGALMFSFICAWVNGGVNNREAGDLRRHRAHYDVIVRVKHVFWIKISWKFVSRRPINTMQWMMAWLTDSYMHATNGYPNQRWHVVLTHAWVTRLQKVNCKWVLTPY